MARRLSATALSYGFLAVVAFWAFGAGALAAQTGRGLHVEAVPAWPFLVAAQLGYPVQVVFRNGAYEVVGPLADAVAGATPIAAMSLVGYAAWLVLGPTGRPSRARANHVVAVHAAALVVLTLMVTSRVLSPQFNIWMLGMVALLLATSSADRALPWLVLGTSVCAQVLYPYLYGDLLDMGAIGFAVQTLRIGMLVAAWWVLLNSLRRAVQDPGGLPADTPDATMGADQAMGKR